MLTISSRALIDLHTFLENDGIENVVFNDGAVEFDGGYATAVWGDHTTVNVNLDSGHEAFAVRPNEARIFIRENK